MTHLLLGFVIAVSVGLTGIGGRSFTVLSRCYPMELETENSGVRDFREAKARRGRIKDSSNLGGLQPEGRFEDHGTWSFVLEKSSGQWRILAYRWGATNEQDWPAKTE